MRLGLALVRVVIGALLFGHGAQKLFGWFGGGGIEGTGQFFESLGLRPGKRHAALAGAAEAGGGALVAAGALSPLGNTLIISSMTQAIRSVHAPKGPWVSDGGYEYNLVLIATMFALADVGPGEWSVDSALGVDRSGPVWATLALLAGVIGPVIVTRQSGAPAQEEQQPQGA